MSLKISHLISVILITTVSLTTAMGCNGCLNQDIDIIRYDCLMDCSSAFNPHTEEADSCAKSCNDFVFNRKCCSSGECASDAETCLATLPSLNFTSATQSLSARSKSPVPVSVAGTSRTRRLSRGNPDAPAQAEVAAAKHQIDRDVSGPIQARFDAGNICCTAVQKVLDTAAPDVAPLLTGEYPQDVQFAGLTLMAFGIAGSAACDFAFGFRCIFKAMTGE